MKKIIFILLCVFLTSPAFALRENNEISVRVLLEAIQDGNSELVEKNAKTLTQKYGKKIWNYHFSCHKNRPSQECSIAEYAFDRVRKTRNAKIFSILIKYGLDITIPFSDGQNALTKSVAIYRDIDLVKMLLKNSETFPINLENENGETALYLALKNNNYEILDYLILKHADIDGKTPSGYPLLYYAWFDLKNKEFATRLLTAGANINGTDQRGNTMLILASKQNDLQQIKNLISSGADINKAGKDGKTPLTYAIENENLKLIDFLIKNGASTNHTDNFGKTLLMSAIESQNINLTKIFLKIPNIIEKKDLNGRTALMFAFEKNNPQLIEILLDHNADIHVSDKNGRNLMMIAAENQNEKLILKLKRNNININAKDNYNDTVLQYALNADASSTFINFLIKNGANQTDERTNRRIVQGNDLNLIDKILKKLGPNIKKKNSNGHDLLFYATKCRDNKLVLDKIDLFQKYGVNLQESYQNGAKITDLIRNDQLIKSKRYWHLLMKTYNIGDADDDEI